MKRRPAKPSATEGGIVRRVPGKPKPTAAGAKPPVRRRRRPPVAAAAVPTGEREPGDRLAKLLAAAGIASRRQCEEFVTEGRVEVDGEVVLDLGRRVDPKTQDIRVDGEPLARRKLVYIAVHKPRGVVCTVRDPAGRPRVIDLVPPNFGRVFPVGRLDLESEGLILLTNDGELSNQLAHPRHGVQKVYHVQVAGLPEVDVLAQLKKGVYLSEGYSHAVNVTIKSRRKQSTILEMVLDEGRNREIRRLLARVGHKVQKLTRIAVGPLRLGEMPVGAHRVLTREEVAALRVAVQTPAKTAGSTRPRRPSTPRAPGARSTGARPTGARPAIGAGKFGPKAPRTGQGGPARKPSTASQKPTKRPGRGKP